MRELPIISTVPISSAPLKRICEWRNYQAGLAAPLSTVKRTLKTTSGNPELIQESFSSNTRDPLLREIPFQGCKDRLDRGAALLFLKLQWQQQLVTTHSLPQHTWATTFDGWCWRVQLKLLQGSLHTCFTIWMTFLRRNPPKIICSSLCNSKNIPVDPVIHKDREKSNYNYEFMQAATEGNLLTRRKSPTKTT